MKDKKASQMIVINRTGSEREDEGAKTGHVTFGRQDRLDIYRDGAAGAIEKRGKVNTAIVTGVTAALLAEPPPHLTVVEVSHDEGTVTLKGEVGSDQVRVKTEQIAARHPKVNSIVNTLRVTPRARR